jgi:CubicO group peptidase (beta-lactamase class C family)
MLSLLFAMLITPPALAQLDSLFKDYSGKQPGLALAIFSDGIPVLQRCYGLARLDEETPVSPNTNFRLASVSKPFTAASILLLASRGTIDLDWSLTEVFAGFPEYGRHIRLRHLLNHTSGLPDYEDYVPEDTPPHALRDAGVLVIIRQTTRPLFPAGTQFSYSNTAYALLALVVEKYSGQSYPDFLSANIFRPLGMSQSLAYIKGGPEPSQRALGHAQLDGHWQERDQSSTSAVLGDGGIYSNLTDFARWDHALSTGQFPLAWAFEAGTLNDGSPIAYGYGWHLKQDARGDAVVYHTGSTTSFRNIYYRIPARKLSVLILSNRNTPDEEEMVGLAEEVLRIFSMDESDDKKD